MLAGISRDVLSCQYLGSNINCKNDISEEIQYPGSKQVFSWSKKAFEVSFDLEKH